jgi:hypothetical protein
MTPGQLRAFIETALERKTKHLCQRPHCGECDRNLKIQCARNSLAAYCRMPAWHDVLVANTERQLGGLYACRLGR